MNKTKSETNWERVLAVKEGDPIPYDPEDGPYDPNDAEAMARLEAIFPGRKVVTVPGREIVLGGGSVHCITQQQPAGSVGIN